MIRVQNTRTMYFAVLLAVVMLALSATPAGAIDSASLATHGAGALAGFGFWDTLTCVGCIAGFVAGAGTTIAGFAVFLSANPEIGILCVSSCAAAV
jgi:hypothetical protein